MPKRTKQNTTKEELNTIIDSFMKVWRSQNHERVKYPEKKTDNSEENTQKIS